MPTKLTINQQPRLTINGYEVARDRKTKAFQMLKPGTGFINGTTSRRILTLDDVCAHTPKDLLEMLLALHYYNDLTHAFIDIKCTGYGMMFLQELLDMCDVDY